MLSLLSVTYGIQGHPNGIGDPSDHLMNISGKICVVDESDDSKEIGFIRGAKIPLSKNADVFEICDAYVGDLGSFCEEVLLKEEIMFNLGAELAVDILYLEAIEIDPEMRGKGIGNAVVSDAVRTFANINTLIVIEPHPLNSRDMSEEDKVVASSALKKYYAVLGFKEIPGANRLMWLGGWQEDMDVIEQFEWSPPS